MGRGQRFAWDVQPMPVLALSPSRGDRFAPLVGAQPVARVAGKIVHTVADREKALDELKQAADGLYADLDREINGATPEHPSGLATAASTNPAWRLFWTQSAAPMFSDWTHFFSEQTAQRTGPAWVNAYIAYGEKWQTDWSTYEHWRQRLLDARATAKKMGIPLHSPEPAELPSTYFEDVEQAAKKAAEKAADVTKDVGKYALIGGGVVGGILLINTLANRR